MHICQVFKRTSPQCFETQARGGGMRGKARMRVVKIRAISGQKADKCHCECSKAISLFALFEIATICHSSNLAKTSWRSKQARKFPPARE